MKALFRLGAHRMDVVQARQCPEPSMFTNNKEKVLAMVKLAANLELVLQQLVRK